MKRLVLFVEGEGEAAAAPVLVKRLLSDMQAWDALRLDENPFRVREVNHLLKNSCREWKRKLEACQKRPSVGGVLLLLDGDARKTTHGQFCAATIAKMLADESKEVGGGATFSVAVVFARQEFESWLIAGIDSLVGRSLPDGRAISLSEVPQNLEENPRNAKGWLNNVIQGGYRPTRDQHMLTELVDMNSIRNRQLRSFRRLESALAELVQAIQNDEPIASPSV